MPGDWHRTIEMAEKIDAEVLECLMPHFTNFQPNSYVYTKSMAEQICESYKNDLPITIVRPSIVVGTEIEPFGGWNDNFNGPGMFEQSRFIIQQFLFNFCLFSTFFVFFVFFSFSTFFSTFLCVR